MQNNLLFLTIPLQQIALYSVAIRSRMVENNLVTESTAAIANQIVFRSDKNERDGEYGTVCEATTAAVQCTVGRVCLDNILVFHCLLCSGQERLKLVKSSEAGTRVWTTRSRCSSWGTLTRACM